jgi:hypothetical protein
MIGEAPNGLPFSRRERAVQDNFKKATILRAKRSDCNGVLARVRVTGSFAAWSFAFLPYRRI